MEAKVARSDWRPQRMGGLAAPSHGSVTNRHACAAGSRGTLASGSANDRDPLQALGAAGNTWRLPWLMPGHFGAVERQKFNRQLECSRY